MTIWEQRAKQALRVATDFTVSRYLMSNAHGRQDGFEKATTHRRLCEVFVSVFRGCKPDLASRHFNDDYEAVHTATQELTGYLDREIGFPLDSDPDYDKLEPLFFDRFYELAIEVLDPKKAGVMVLDYDNPAPFYAHMAKKKKGKKR